MASYLYPDKPLIDHIAINVDLLNKIYIDGSAYLNYSDQTNYPMLFRINKNGGFDTTFGHSGFVTGEAFGTTGYNNIHLYSIKFDNKNNLLLTGSGYNLSDNKTHMVAWKFK